MAVPVSVVMPVRNAGPFLDAAIESILAQSFGDFEFVIRDDGSSDGSTERLRAWAERGRRIRLFIGDAPLGPAGSSNWVVRQSLAPLVARMDADDLAHPDRLRRQLQVLRGDPSACLVGSLWEGIDAAGRVVRPRDRSRPAQSGPFAPFPHGSILFRRAAFDAAGGYREECSFWEDADLYQRLARIGRLLVLPDALYRHRASVLSTRLVSPARQVEEAVDRMLHILTPAALTPAAPHSDKVQSMVFVSLGSTRLWGGAAPVSLRHLRRRAVFGADLKSAAVVAWALWGRISPRSLRALLRLRMKQHDRRCAERFPDGQPVVWDPHSRTALPASVEAALPA